MSGLAGLNLERIQRLSGNAQRSVLEPNPREPAFVHRFDNDACRNTKTTSCFCW